MLAALSMLVISSVAPPSECGVATVSHGNASSSAFSASESQPLRGSGSPATPKQPQVAVGGAGDATPTTGAVKISVAPRLPREPPFSSAAGGGRRDVPLSASSSLCVFFSSSSSPPVMLSMSQSAGITEA